MRISRPCSSPRFRACNEPNHLQVVCRVPPRGTGCPPSRYRVPTLQVQGAHPPGTGCPPSRYRVPTLQVQGAHPSRCPQGAPPQAPVTQTPNQGTLITQIQGIQGTKPPEGSRSCAGCPHRYRVPPPTGTGYLPQARITHSGGPPPKHLLPPGPLTCRVQVGHGPRPVRRDHHVAPQLAPSPAGYRVVMACGLSGVTTMWPEASSSTTLVSRSERHRQISNVGSTVLFVASPCPCWCPLG